MTLGKTKPRIHKMAGSWWIDFIDPNGAQVYTLDTQFSNQPDALAYVQDGPACRAFDAAISSTGTCDNCGTKLPPGCPVADYCEKCPPHRCDSCGQMDSIQDSCPCWIKVSDIAPADLKAMLARDDMGITTDGRWTHEADK